MKIQSQNKNNISFGNHYYIRIPLQKLNGSAIQDVVLPVLKKAGINPQKAIVFNDFCSIQNMQKALKQAGYGTSNSAIKMLKKAGVSVFGFLGVPPSVINNEITIGVVTGFIDKMKFKRYTKKVNKHIIAILFNSARERKLLTEKEDALAKVFITDIRKTDCLLGYFEKKGAKELDFNI